MLSRVWNAYANAGGCNMSDFDKQMIKLDKLIGDLIELIEDIGLNPNDEDHCIKVLTELYDDVEEMTGMF